MSYRIWSDEGGHNGLLLCSQKCQRWPQNFSCTPCNRNPMSIRSCAGITADFVRTFFAFLLRTPEHSPGRPEQHSNKVRYNTLLIPALSRKNTPFSQWPFKTHVDRCRHIQWTVGAHRTTWDNIEQDRTCWDGIDMPVIYSTKIHLTFISHKATDQIPVMVSRQVQVFFINT